MGFPGLRRAAGVSKRIYALASRTRPHEKKRLSCVLDFEVSGTGNAGICPWGLRESFVGRSSRTPHPSPA